MHKQSVHAWKPSGQSAVAALVWFCESEAYLTQKTPVFHDPSLVGSEDSMLDPSPEEEQDPLWTFPPTLHPSTEPGH